MSFRSGIVLLASLSALAVLMGCGSSSSTPSAPGQSSTTLSELNGTYAFSVTGTDSSTTPEFFAMTGAFTANGSGGITGGAMDFVDPNVGQGSALAISNGSYSVGSDGRGTGKFSVTSIGTIVFDFVLTSSSHGLITRFDNGGSGSGTFDLQGAQTGISGSYAFSFSGIDTNANILSVAGVLTISGGNLTGFQDSNDAGAVVSQAVTGTLTAGSGTAPGTATITSTLGSLAFDVYAVDQTHLKFIESDAIDILAGDAFTQQSAAIPSGPAVFTLGGISSSGTIAAGGLLAFNSDLSVSGGSEDVNNNGTLLSTISFTGSYTAPSGGRSVLTLSSFTPAVTFAIYPSSGGLIMQEIDGLALMSGTALAQTATSFSTSGGYGFSLSAENLGSAVEVDDIAAFTATSSSISGTIDENDQGLQLSPSQTLSGTYTATGGGRGTMPLQGGSFNADYYVADSGTVLLIETDAGQVGTGLFLGQNAVGDSASAIVRVAMARPKAGAHASQKMKRLN